MPYKDLQKQKEAQRQWYLNNKKKCLESSKRSKPGVRRRRALWVSQIKETLTCVECGEDRGPCLTFHHTDPTTKIQTIARIAWEASKEKVIEEIKKCIVLCQNCHTLLHWEAHNGKYVKGCIA
jgi:hypothetical protein